MISYLFLAASLSLSVSASAQGFPSSAVLAAFNATIGGKLHVERPIGAVCYPADPLYNAAACATVTANYHNDQYRSDSFSGYEQINWETCGVESSCLVPPPNATAVCGQGSVPSYSVHATTASDVEQYVKFATKYNLRITIKNTGHDYAGRSAAPGGFALWTHKLNTISRNKAFVPHGCSVPPQDSVTLGSGVQWGAAYQFANDQGILVVGGDSPQVGAAGGWIQGGGHSVLSPKYGLGVDNLLEANIVTPDGKLQTISQCSNPDLFWAIRGGGGGTWGVITQVTYKAHPVLPITAVFLSSNSSTDANGVQENSKLVGQLAAISPRLGQLGVGGFINIYASAFTYFGLLSGGNVTDFKNALHPLTSVLPASRVSYVNYTTYLEFFQATFGTSNEAVGITTFLTSRLVPTHYFQKDPQGLAKAILNGQIAQGGISTRNSEPIQILVDNPPPSLATGNTSVTPAWYNSLWHVIYLTTYPNNAPLAQQKAQVAAVHNAAQVLRNYAPDGGAYQNEADVYEPNHEASFWGANAARLKSIKAAVDPRNYFHVWHGIGWTGTSDPKYACYAELSPSGQIS